MATKAKKQPAPTKAQKKKKNSKQRKRRGLELPLENNHEALRFLSKLAAYRKAQLSGVLPSDVPFKWSEFFKGTQTPTVRVYMSRNLVSATAATNINSTYLLTAAQFQHFSDLAAVFDEYRPIGGGVYYVPGCITKFTNGSDHQGPLETSIGVIDYDNTTALASFNEGLEYDTKQWFNLVSYASEKAEKTITHWPVRFERLPDQEWLDTATTNTAFATFKMFTDGNDIPFTNARVGSVCGWMDFQFRGSG